MGRTCCCAVFHLQQVLACCGGPVLLCGSIGKLLFRFFVRLLFQGALPTKNQNVAGVAFVSAGWDSSETPSGHPPQAESLVARFTLLLNLPMSSSAFLC